MSPPYLRRVE